MQASPAAGVASTLQSEGLKSSIKVARWESWTDELADAGSTEQRRLRHLTEILIRNLHVPTATSATQAYQRQQQRLLHIQQIYFNSSPEARECLPGQTSASSSPARIRRTLRPSASRRFLSYDDSDITYGQLEASSSASGLPSAAGPHALPALRRQGSHLRSAEKRRRRAASNSILDIPSTGAPLVADSRGKKKAPEPLTSTGSVSKSEAAFEIADGHAGLPPAEGADSDVVFGWMSAAPPVLNRTKSDRSTRSSTIRRSLISQRLFRRRDTRTRYDESEEDETHRPTSPHSAQVSFQTTEPPSLPMSVDGAGNLVEDVLPYFAYRDRSASLYSLASASSGSTIHPLPPGLPPESKPRPAIISEEEEVSQSQKGRSYHKRFYRQLYCTRITISLPTSTAPALHENDPRQHSSGRAPTSHSTVQHNSTTRQRLLKQRSFERLQHSPTVAPFFTSLVHRPSSEPSFVIDTATIASNLPEADRRNLLRLEQVTVSVFIDRNSKQHVAGHKTSSPPTWELLTQWDINLQALTSLGSDSKLFPQSLPKNTLIFRLSGSGDYYTARIPLFARDDSFREEESDTSLSSDEDADGNISDPGPDALSRAHSRRAAKNIERDHMNRQRTLARRQMIYERSLRETKMLSSCDDAAIRELMRLTQQLEQGRQEDSSRQERIDAILCGDIMRHHRSYYHQEHVTTTRRWDLDTVRSARKQSDRQMQDLQIGLKLRRANLARAHRLLLQKHSALNEHIFELEHDRTIVKSIKLSATRRRANLIADVANIFPIELLDPSNLLFSICGVAIPNSNLDPAQQPAMAIAIPMDDDTLSSGIGFVAHAVQLLATYLTIPLHYPLICLSSRTVIQDPISQIKGSKVFPLYARGVDRYRFDYGMFLLNKDIEQLMLENGIVVLDIGQTLPNLKNLLLTLSSDAPGQLAAMSDKPAAFSPLDSPMLAHDHGSFQSISASPSSIASSPRLAKLKRELQQQGALRTSSNLNKGPATASSMALEKLLEASMFLGTRSIAERPRLSGQ